MTPQEQAAKDRLDALQLADHLSQLLQMPGWKHLYDMDVAELEEKRRALLDVDTSDPQEAIAKLQQWQIAEKALQGKALYINRALAVADEIRGSVTLTDALLMEKVNEQQSAGDSGSRSDSAGY